jgi:hypothetical protein
MRGDASRRVQMQPRASSRARSHRWFDPSGGQWYGAGPIAPGEPAATTKDGLVFRAPDDLEWALDLRAAAS